MYEANVPIMFLMLAGVLAAEARRPGLPLSTRLGFRATVLLFAAASFWDLIPLPIGRGLGSVLNVVCPALLGISVFIIPLRTYAPEREKTSKT